MLEVLNYDVYNITYVNGLRNRIIGKIIHTDSKKKLFDFIGSNILEKGYTLNSVSRVSSDGISYKINLEKDELYNKVKKDSIRKIEAKKIIHNFLNLENCDYNLQYFTENICRKIILKTNEYIYDLNWDALTGHSDKHKRDINYFIKEGKSKIKDNEGKIEKDVLILKNCRVPILDALLQGIKDKWSFSGNVEFKEPSYYIDLDKDFKSKLSSLKIEYDIKEEKIEPVTTYDIYINIEDLTEDLANTLINALGNYHLAVKEECNCISDNVLIPF